MVGLEIYSIKKVMWFLIQKTISGFKNILSSIFGSWKQLDGRIHYFPYLRDTSTPFSIPWPSKCVWNYNL